MESIFESMGGTYRQAGDYMLPVLTLPEETEADIGIWGLRHAGYLKQHHRVRYYNLLTSGKLSAYLSDVNAQAVAMEEAIVQALSEKEGLTERMKAEAPMAWVQKRNSIRSRAREIVNSEIIFG